MNGTSTTDMSLAIDNAINFMTELAITESQHVV